MEEIEISIKHMFYSIIKRWRKIIIWMVLGALALDAFAVYRSGNKTVSSEYVDITSYKTSLTRDERKEVEAAAASFKEYESVYESASDYIKSSIRMNLDAKAVSTCELTYSVNTHYEVEYPVIEKGDLATDILNAYIGTLNNEDMYMQILDGTGWNVKTAYIKELIIPEIRQDSNTFVVRILAPNKEQGILISDVVKTTLQDKTPALQELYGDFDLLLVGDSYYVEANRALMADQQAQLTTYATAKATYEAQENPYDGAQASYYNALVNNAKLDAKALIEEEEEDDYQADISYINLKFIVIGLAVGLVLSVFWLALVYIVGMTIRTKDDMSDAFGISLLGNIRMVATKKKICRGIDKLVDKMFYGKGPQFTEDERLAMICAGIRISAEKGDMKTVFVTGSCNDSETERIKDAIFTSLRDAEVEIKLGGSMVYDPESLETMSASGGVVLVERTGYSLYEDILREKELCAKYEIPVIGGVVLE